jgi:hypothetical protein
MPLPPKAEYQWWYQYYFATERDREGYEKYRDDFGQVHPSTDRRQTGGDLAVIFDEHLLLNICDFRPYFEIDGSFQPKRNHTTNRDLYPVPGR